MEDMVSAAVPSGSGRVLGGLGAVLRERADRVVRAAVTPLEPSDVLDLFAPLRRGGDLRARIVSVHAETSDAATLVLKPGKDWRGHTPGQFIRIGIDISGVRYWRAYSLTHGPRADGHISITVKAVPGGVVSNHLVHEAAPGTLVHLDQAAGEFVLPQAPGKLLFVTAGSGITPVIGILRNLFPVTDSGVLRLPRSREYDIVVLHVAPSEPSSIFLRNLRELDAAGAISLRARYDDVHGVLDVAEIEALVPDLDERTTYACGPHGLLDSLREHHEERGIPLFTEQFRVPTIVAGDGGTVSYASGPVVHSDGATPILDAAEDAGILMPSGCRMGICMGCVLPLREGAVRDLRNGELTVAIPGETHAGGIKIQTCISAAAGACVIDH
jgi:stearoyl-CoA 9-desaturase NADPH oxidoreductase